MSDRYKISNETREWFEKYYKDSRKPVVELTNLYNESFKVNFSTHKIKNIASQLKIRKKCCYLVYGEELMIWLKNNKCNYSNYDDLYNAHIKHFGKEIIKRKNLPDVCNHLGILNHYGRDITQFKKGERNNSPFLHKIGEEVEYKGVVWVKLTDNFSSDRKCKLSDNWVQKKRYLYEQYNNDIIKPNEVIIFLNGDNHDFNKENLLKITRGELVRINQFKAFGNKELTLALLDVYRAEKCIKEFQKTLYKGESKID